MELKFKDEFTPLILRGIKTQTARTTTKGIHIGDIVDAVDHNGPFACLRIKSVCQKMLVQFDEEDAKREGCIDLADFRRVWEQLHPRKGWNGVQVVYVFQWQVESDYRVKNEV
jgi:hypothetical protein